MGLALSSIYTNFNTLKKKRFRKTLWKGVKLLRKHCEKKKKKSEIAHFEQFHFFFFFRYVF